VNSQRLLIAGNYEMLLARLLLLWSSEDWFRSYLNSRRQKVSANSPNSLKNFFSGWDMLKHGVPKDHSRASGVHNMCK
jgi:hypothetical protein